MRKLLLSSVAIAVMLAAAIPAKAIALWTKEERAKALSEALKKQHYYNDDEDYDDDTADYMEEQRNTPHVSWTGRYDQA
jgi:hypothetical protein